MAGTRKIRFVSTAVILCILLGIGLFLFWKPKAQREDYRAIASEEYNTVFLSMYPVDTYHAEDFAYYRGLNAWKASYCIPDLSTLQEYLQRIAASGNT